MRPPTLLILLAALVVAACRATPPPTIERPSLAADVAPAPHRSSSGVGGIVTDASGAPVTGAVVLAFVGVEDDAPFATTRTGSDGRFRFEGLAAGTWRLTASAPAGLAILDEPVAFASTDASIDVALRLEPATHVLEGTVQDELGGSVAGTTVLLNELSERPGSLFGVVTDARGGYRVGISTEAPYVATAAMPGRGRFYRRVASGETTVAPLELPPPPAPRPDDEAVAAWLRRDAKPLDGLRPSSASLADLDAIGAMIGSARLIALGEAAHGASEFQTMKHRLLQHLVEREGVTVFAMEMGATEAIAADDYVVHGKGDPRRILHDAQTFVWETQEMVALLEWMRAWNADPRHATKIRFEGFDVTAFGAVRGVADYLKKVDAGVGANFEAGVAPLLAPSSDGSYGALPRAQQAATRAALDHARDRIEDRKRAYVTRAGQPAWDLAMRQLAAARQAEAVFREPLSRDAAMASNVEAMVGRHPAGARFALWMHNSHASAEGGRLLDMGHVLRQTFGADYFVLGFAFGRGSFRAFRWGDPSFEVRELAVGDPAPEGFDAALGLAGLPLFAVDLRRADGAVREWLDSPLLAWSVGGAYVDDASARMRVAPAQAYDAVVYIDRVTATHPLPRAK